MMNNLRYSPAQEDSCDSPSLRMRLMLNQSIKSTQHRKKSTQLITTGKDTINVRDVDPMQGMQRLESHQRKNSSESVTTDGTSELPNIGVRSPRNGLTEVNSVVSSRNLLSVADFIKANKANGRYNNEEFEYIMPGTVGTEELNGGRMATKSKKISFFEQNTKSKPYNLPIITFSSPRNWKDGHTQLGKFSVGKKTSFLEQIEHTAQRFPSPPPGIYNSDAWKKHSRVRSINHVVGLKADRITVFEEAQANSSPPAKYKLVNIDKVLSRKVQYKRAK